MTPVVQFLRFAAPMVRAIRVLGILGVAALAAAIAAACNDAPLIGVPECHSDHCTCEQDPTDPGCAAFNNRPETSPGEPSDASERSDASDDGVSDARDGGDEGG